MALGPITPKSGRGRVGICNCPSSSFVYLYLFIQYLHRLKYVSVSNSVTNTVINAFPKEKIMNILGELEEHFWDTTRRLLNEQ